MRRILVGVDGSPQGDKAFAFALQMASQFQGELHCCSVVYGADIEMAEARDRDALVEKQRERIKTHLHALSEQASAQGVKPQLHVLQGHPVEQLLLLADKLQIDHMILGHRSKGLFERLLMGSVAKRVVDFARCSVTVVR